MKHDSISLDEKAAALLRGASYLGRPQQFMAIADARAEMRRTLELAAKGSVVLTTHGEPAAAVVPFTTLEDMRRALLHGTSPASRLKALLRTRESRLNFRDEQIVKRRGDGRTRWRSNARSATTAP